MTFKYSLILFCFLGSLPCWTQSLDLVISAGHNQYKEELIQPLSYRGAKLGLGLHFDKTTIEETKISATWLLTGGIGASTKLNNTLDQLTSRLEISYLKSLKPSRWYSGISLLALHEYSLYSLNYEYPFWLTQYSLGWSNRFDLSLGSNSSLEMTVSIPLIGLYSRTERDVLYVRKEDFNLAYLHKNMSVETVSEFQSISGSIFFRPRNDRRLMIGYQGWYHRYSKPKPVTSMFHSVIVRLSLISKK